METESEQNPNSAGAGSGGSARPQIAQMSLYERQAVQALQALQRQPNAAQYFHQFMLQQQLSNAQLHSLAAVQQATIAASRQASSPNPSAVPPPQPASTTQASMNAAPTPAAAAQLASRSQSASSPGATTLTQSVLLGNAASPPLSQSQAQMYLRVNRTLGRNVPLASQLILMPNGAVAAVQPEGPPAPPGAPSPGGHPDPAAAADQVQNLAVRGAPPAPSAPTPAPGAQMPGSGAKAAGPGAAPASGPALAAPGPPCPSVNLSPAGAGAGGGGLPGPLGLGAGGPAPGGGGGGGGLGPLPASPALAGGGCPRKGTGVVQPLPAAAQAAALGPGGGGGGGAEAEAAKKAEGDAAGAGGGAAPSAGVNLTRTAAPAPSQTLISSATYTQIQPHSLIQRQQQIHLQQKQVVIQQQIAIHHQPQFPHRQSQLLHAAAAAAHLQLQPPPAAPPAAPAPPPPAAHPPAPPGPPPPPPPPAPTQTLVVQPMLQAAPLPIQAKPAAAAAPAPPPKPPAPGAAPHIPVQVVGARQPGPAHAQALGLAQLAATVPAARGPAPPAGPALAAALPPSAQAPGPGPPPHDRAPPPMPLPPGAAPAGSPATAAAFYLQPAHLTAKPPLAVKRKAESEEERGALPARGAEDKGGLGEKAEAASGGAPSLAGGELEAAALAPAPPAPAPSLALVSRPAGDSRPPQAIVKPQILTHIIEGFVIQEGAEPFPVACAQLLKESEKALPSGLPPGLGQSPSGGALGGDSPSVELEKPASLLKCEYCGKYAPAEQFRGSKRFCSMTCAKRYNVSCSHQFRLKRKKMKEFQEASYARVRRRGPRRSSADMARAKAQGKRHRGQEDSSRGSDNSSYDEALSPTSPGPLGRAGHAERELGGALAAPPTPELHGASPEFLPAHPSRWSVEEVYEFIASLQGCQDIAEEFRSQEIDGQALLLLKEEHLMSAMNLKLGPALKICAKINVLKEA